MLDARGLRQGDKGTIFVSTLFVGNKVYAIPDKGGKREAKTIIDKLDAPTASSSTRARCTWPRHKNHRYDNIEDKLDNPAEPVMIYDKLPGGNDHSWKFLASGPTTSSTSRSARPATSATRASTPRSTA